MKIAANLQVFDSPVIVTDKDRQRLSSHLSGWNHLHEIFLLGVNIPDLKRLVLLELEGQKRQIMLDRLLARISVLEKKQIKDKVKSCLLSSKVIWKNKSSITLNNKESCV